ncbi:MULTISPECIES: fasciclin domain-containing protein [unclassified Polaribacter]|uniref:fasciclin domain-containing protein n=1 Tax=unclassified Polaribacter TaxID=196858 RepID=UPI0011BE63D0|nr:MULTISPECIES: fasciclin domain-containing protein [unclassified Polaribacter]TXD53069.1 fasciclin domain-containing protein [Polaribacter sp. IC063]TXD59018.1 fasciclin domain-containing protein [Polaribacter sp. IC066]
MNTKNLFIAFAIIGIFALTSATVSKTTVSDSIETVQTPNIVGVAAANKDFTTLVAAVKAAGLVETLSSAGPFTVFAPTNAAFAKLPAGTVPSLLKPESKATLTSILTYHVVAGKFDAAAVVEAIEANDGAFEITTVQGGTLVASLVDGNVMLEDENGNMSKVVIADVAASNGVIHAIDSVVMPN